MQQLLLTRASTLAAFTDLLRDMGAPVDRELGRNNLPSLVDLTQDHFVPVLPSQKFVRGMERNEQIDDIVFRALDRNTRPDLTKAPFSNALGAVTLYSLLRNFCTFVHRENPGFRFSMRRDNSDVTIVIDVDQLLCEDDLHYCDWTIVLQIISIMRGCLGLKWSPTTLRFRPLFSPCDGALAQLANSGIRFGCAETSVSFPAECLGLRPRADNRPSNPSEMPPSDEAATGSPTLDLPMSLELALRSYVGDGYPDVRLAAEILGTSVRTLQRRLSRYDLSYSDVVERARFEVATALLRDTGSKIIDVAYAAGYNDPSNFSRAFRRMAGVGPREYRRSNFAPA